MASILGGHPSGADASVVKNSSREFFRHDILSWRKTMDIPVRRSGPAKHAGRSITARANGSQAPRSHPTDFSRRPSRYGREPGKA